ncbi:DMT family transporter [Marinobacter sp. F3R08]|uniref:DMT family transporter n=1 Tax=Marinobacter sp. F3R08 TaxID=2841559 RepID=UPI001C08D29E|nr:DMT family transporter [Marinobacter sp. F3R08]MBU2953759.1 DMT family transporter [Marinobacter sp. F3R08]
MMISIQRPTISPQTIVWGLLITNGFLIALMLALAKTATSQGVPAVSYAFWQTFIAGSLLLSTSQQRRTIFAGRLTRYFVISGLTGIAVPNVIAFFLVTKLGSGFTGIMYALPPIFTVLIATRMGLEKRSRQRLFGLTLAVLACVWILWQRHSELNAANPLWFLLGLIIPAMLAIGNVYRSVAWPEHADARTLAAGTLLVSAIVLGVFATLTDSSLIPAGLGTPMVGLMALQGLLTAATYVCAFEVQRRASPVFYSQLGAVAAVFGLIIGLVWFNETYSFAIWVGVAGVVLGLRLGNGQPRLASVKRASRISSDKSASHTPH